MNRQLSGLQYGIIALTVITGLIHLFLGVTSLGTTLGVPFILNGLAYLGLIVAFYFIPQLQSRHELIRWLLILLAAATFVLYFVFNWPNIWSPVGIFTKAVELVLIILLFVDRPR